MDSILHIGSVAGVSQDLSAAQRRLGQKSDILSFEYHDFGYRTDFHYPLKLDYSFKQPIYLSNPINLLKKMPRLLALAKDYDLLHFHYSSGLPFGLDFPLWRFLHKKIVIHHHGTDIRNKGEHWFLNRFAQRIFVSTPDLLEWSQNAIWIPNPLDLEYYPYVGAREMQTNDTDPIKIVHAPSSRKLKGTEHVLRAIKHLKNQDYNIKLILVENMPHKKAVEYYKQADIVIDQLLIGWYGMIAQECMALGKPVCVYLRQDLEGYIPSHPMINTTCDNIEKNLKQLIEDAALRSNLGKKGRIYVEKVHNSDRIARRLLDIYP